MKKRLKLYILSICELRKIFFCVNNKEDKTLVQNIKTDKKKLDEFLDLENLLKNLKKVTFFQALLLKKLGINPAEY